jgi:hypothetical protein
VPDVALVGAPGIGANGSFLPVASGTTVVRMSVREVKRGSERNAVLKVIGSSLLTSAMNESSASLAIAESLETVVPVPLLKKKK